jgi:putative transposase
LLEPGAVKVARPVLRGRGRSNAPPLPDNAGRTVVAVNPRHTSQRCSSCDRVAAENRRREKFRCVACGFTDHADLNAARNILRAGLAHGGSEGHLANAERVSR